MAVDEALRRRTFEVLPAGGMAARTRAMLKVEDGCVNFCTYCIIPYARGPVRSLPLEEAVRQMNLVDHTFFAFKNADDGGAFAVVYKRNDGGYGIIVDQD